MLPALVKEIIGRLKKDLAFSIGMLYGEAG
jgi:hypothetical protein